MPELPEVETVMRGLAPVMTGQFVARAQINRPDLRRPFPAQMSQRLTGARVLGLYRRSKYILADLSSGETLLIHLGMSGRILVSGAESGQFFYNHPIPTKHDHVVLDFKNGARLTFNDPRRFGAMDMFATPSAMSHPLLASLGPEPLGNHFSSQGLLAALKGRKAPIKSALLDQRIIAGLGNIYVCETLYRAKIHPQTLAGNVSAKQISALVLIIRTVLQAAIEAGGSSLKDFRQAYGGLGYFQHSFDVYGRENEPCHTPDCHTKVTRITQAGRSTFMCPTCQR
jgi:formamidopyrimidine-DNA glycosylase